VCDVTKREVVMDVASKTLHEVGPVDVLINNAGIVSGSNIDELEPEKIQRTFAVNVISHFWTIKAFLPKMIERQTGHIVTIASAAGLGGTARLTDYCASKFAAVGLDESLRHELQHRGLDHSIKTTCVCPFYINTGMFDGVTTRFPMLLPILTENYASRKIVHAIRTDEVRYFIFIAVCSYVSVFACVSLVLLTSLPLSSPCPNSIVFFFFFFFFFFCDSLYSLCHV
jgi:all-trans-retinol dehydrogenase (NAD+)